MMIGINNFGWRLGNQMFQLAAAVALARSNNDYVAFPEWDYAEYFAGDFTPQDFHGVYEHKEDGFHYKAIPYRKALGLNGYFQSEKYFHSTTNSVNTPKIIRDMFAPKYDWVRPLHERFITHKNDNNITETCAIHVRRGDYLKLPNHHPVVPIEWYEQAMESMGDVYFYVFSDDTAWCEEAFDNVTVVKDQTDVQDFFMQQMCDNHIIANSSYSWWAAWLGEKGRVIAPKRWFGPAYDEWNTKDLIPERWEIM